MLMTMTSLFLDDSYTNGCFYEEVRCRNLGQTYPCICPGIKRNKTCDNGKMWLDDLS